MESFICKRFSDYNQSKSPQGNPKPWPNTEADMSEISPEHLPNLRQEKLSSTLVGQHLDALVLNPGPSLTYLTGLHFHLMERPVVAIFIPHSPPTIVLPELETAKVAGLPYEVLVFPYGEDPDAWSGVFHQAALAQFVHHRSVRRRVPHQHHDGQRPRCGLKPLGHGPFFRIQLQTLHR